MRLLIIGCSGQGEVAADIAIKMNIYKEICFLDDSKKQHECLGFPVIGTTEYNNFQNDDEIFIAIGNADVRQKLQIKYSMLGLKIATLIHPKAVIGTNTQIGIGTIIMAGAIINPKVILGEGVIVNTCASIDHDSCIGNYCHVSVGAHLAGNVKVGERTWIGIGSIISNNIRITDDVVLGAGCVVIKNITHSGTYVGVPSKLLHD